MTRKAIAQLPKEPSKDASSEIVSLLHGFTSDLAHHVEGIADEDGLLQKIHPLQENFRKAILATAPHFVPFERNVRSTTHLPKFSFLSHEEDEEEAGEEDGEEDGEEGSQPVLGDFSARVDKFQTKDPIYVDDVLFRARRYIP